jgi:hypothetical protein
MNIQSCLRGEPEMKLLDIVKIRFISTVIMMATGFQTGRFLWKNDNKITVIEIITQEPEKSKQFNKLNLIALTIFIIII